MTSPRLSLRERARPPTPAETESIGWLRELDARDRAAALGALRVTHAATGERVCRAGAASNWWFGVLDGLLKMTNDMSQGGSITYIGLPPGAWFGEGTLLKHESYRYSVEALRPSLVAGLPVQGFDSLLARSIAFNRIVMGQLNERLGQFIAAREIDRDTRPDAKVARGLAALFDPVLYPRADPMLRITQSELALLIGLSRQRVNTALRTLAARGWIRIEYGGVEVLDLPRLRSGEVGRGAG